jgi:hypothetical protein
MKKLLVGLAALPFLASVALAGQPTVLSDSELDRVTAGDIIVHFTFLYTTSVPFIGPISFPIDLLIPLPGVPR